MAAHPGAGPGDGDMVGTSGHDYGALRARMTVPACGHEAGCLGDGPRGSPVLFLLLMPAMVAGVMPRAALHGQVTV